MHRVLGYDPVEYRVMIPYMRMARIVLDHILTGTVRIYDRWGATVPLREAGHSCSRYMILLSVATVD